MRPDFLYRPGGFNISVLADIKMITRPVESPPAVAVVQIKLGKALVLTRGGAVHHNQIDIPHDLTLRLLWHYYAARTPY